MSFPTSESQSPRTAQPQFSSQLIIRREATYVLLTLLNTCLRPGSRCVIAVCICIIIVRLLRTNFANKIHLEASSHASCGQVTAVQLVCCFVLRSSSIFDAKSPQLPEHKAHDKVCMYVFAFICRASHLSKNRPNETMVHLLR